MECKTFQCKATIWSQLSIGIRFGSKSTSYQIHINTANVKTTKLNRLFIFAQNVITQLNKKETL